jgi:hypothetical protein
LASHLACAAHESVHAAPEPQRNLVYAQTLLQLIALRLLLFVGEIDILVCSLLAASARTIKRRMPKRSAPRNHPPIKLHLSTA